MEWILFADLVFVGINQQNFEQQSFITRIHQYWPLFLVIKDCFFSACSLSKGL